MSPGSRIWICYLPCSPGSATGQNATSYTTILSGPRRQGEKDGPEAFHLIIVDNQRSSILSTEFEDALNCIRCGACLNICPVYRQVGGHAYGWVYSGPIGAVLTPLYKGMEEWGEVAQASSLCGACYETCPVKIPLHDMLIGIRRESAAAGYTHPLERLAFRGFGWMMKRPALYRTMQRAGRWLQRPLVREGRFRYAPPPLSSWVKSRSLPALADRSFREVWRSELSREREPRLELGGEADRTGERGRGV